MKKVDEEMEDELRAEYDLKSLRVRKFGTGRKNFGDMTVRLEPDVAEMFPNADAPNFCTGGFTNISRYLPRYR
ncbi:hypothetical protein NIES4071_22150 [Calothrix sp. NIES-4071]|nr:hypothetical protein NIES4071_22150 [Calothrix sp. NIES-4071]BAZ56547.1 hypothetical protein NIES4105_22100 [Calothrix sp. NIES-4105]